ncbi:MAG TPA: LCP family protein [Actinomycetota bacterium]|nr:LCP family protein [Actinomycetota bacterium]
MNYSHFEPRDPRLDQTALLYPEYPEQYPAAPPPRRRPYWRRRLLAGVSLLLLLAIVGAVAGAFYFNSRLSEVRRVSPAGLAQVPGGAMTVLMVGSDSRADLVPGQEHRFGSGTQVSGKRSDAIMLLRTDPGTGQAAVLSIPRDLWVPIAGTGKSNRINTAYAGGPDRMVNTITSALGIPIEHYVEVNFDGFRGIVDAIGGLNVYFPAPARDILAELNVPAAGCVHLDGEQGLAYVRSRHYEFLENGRWKADPTSDHGRIQRQQDFIRRMVKKSITQGVRNPLTAGKLMDSFVRDVVVDDGLGTLDLARLGMTFRALGSDGIEMLTIPTTGARINGNSVLKMKEPEAGQVISRFLNPPPKVEAPPPEAVSPADVRVQVLNGSGRAGEAGEASSKLSGIGFRQAGTGDAAPRSGASLLRFPPGAEAKAALVQGYVGGPVELKTDPSIKGADVVLTTGRAFTGIGSSPAAAPAAPAAPPPPANPAAECFA